MQLKIFYLLMYTDFSIFPKSSNVPSAEPISRGGVISLSEEELQQFRELAREMKAINKAKAVEREINS